MVAEFLTQSKLRRINARLMSTPNPTQLQEIEFLAYLIWERNGRPEGRSLDHWLEAEYLMQTYSFSV